MLLRDYFTRATFLADLALLVQLYVRGWYDFYAVAYPNFKLKFGSVAAYKSYWNHAYHILHEILRIFTYDTWVCCHSHFWVMGGQRLVHRFQYLMAKLYTNSDDKPNSKTRSARALFCTKNCMYAKKMLPVRRAMQSSQRSLGTVAY